IAYQLPALAEIRPTRQGPVARREWRLRGPGGSAEVAFAGSGAAAAGARNPVIPPRQAMGALSYNSDWDGEGGANAMSELADTFDAAFSKAVDLGNRIADKDKDADLWDIADGLLAGAIQYWLYSRQPCGDPRCQDCMPISTAQGRMAELNRLIGQLASESEYFHTPTDANAGRA